MWHVWCDAPATQNEDGGLQSATPATKTATHLVEHQNEHFVPDFLQFSYFVASKSMFSYEPSKLLPQNRCFVRGFRQLSSHLTNATPATEFAPCHHLTQPWQCDSQKSRHKTRLTCCACPAKWRWTRLKCCACHENCNASSENVAKVLRLPHISDFRHVTKHVWMSRSATPATRNEATRRLKPPKFCRTHHRQGHSDLVRTVANSCERFRTVANSCAPSREHTLNPQTPSETGTLATHSG